MVDLRHLTDRLTASFDDLVPAIAQIAAVSHRLAATSEPLAPLLPEQQLHRLSESLEEMDVQLQSATRALRRCLRAIDATLTTRRLVAES